MDKCSKKDCVDFDVSEEAMDLTDNCNICDRNKRNPAWVSSDEQYLKVEGKPVNPTDDVPAQTGAFPILPQVGENFAKVNTQIPSGDVCNTGLAQKAENFSAFAELISNQFQHGGAKYKLKGDKEFTDAICEAFPGESGVDWVLGTCMKYLGRYKNFRREKDLLKIATYMYLCWLKGGFHLSATHDEDIKRSG